jgi:RimJ/RimL family protein N-acetyltransferase
MSEVVYRLAGPADFPILQEFYSKYNEHLRHYGYRLPRPENIGETWLESFRRTLGKFSIVYIAEFEGQVVGFLLARIKRLPPYLGGVLVGELSDEWIEPIVRRLGVGSHMCHMAIDWLKKQKVHSVEAQVQNGNEASWGMVAEMGFKQELRVGRLMWDEYIPENPKGDPKEK